MEALAEQPSRVRLPAVIVWRQRTACFAVHYDVPQIAALRGIAGKDRPLGFRFDRGRADRDLAAAIVREAVGTDPSAGEIVGCEFPDRHCARNRGGQRIRGAMILVRAFERRHPNRLRPAACDRGGDIGSGGVEVEAQAPRGRLAKADDLGPEKPRGAQGLFLPAPDPLQVARPLPSPQRVFGRDASRQMQHKDARPGRDRAGGGNAAGDDLVIGMRRQDQNAAGNRAHYRAGSRTCAAARHTGSRSCSRTSRQLGTRRST